jgi:UPF0755 protein
LRKVLIAVGMIIVAMLAGTVGLRWYLTRPLQLPTGQLEVVVRPGATLQSVARDMTGAGVHEARWLPALARFTGKDRQLKAGRYHFESGQSLPDILEAFVAGKVALASLTIVEGWRFQQLKEAIRAHPDIEKTALDLPDAQLLELIGTVEKHPEGLFLPDTYLFASGSTDVVVLRRAYRTMQDRLAIAWQARDPNLPYRNEYEALIMASIIEKETSRPAERGLVASVFVNRLRLGMKLQTDPTVIYGIGARFGGNLRRRDLETDTAYNTYTRTGLPPTPIALPGLASLDAALRPPSTRLLYFVARGDGSSEFSTNLPDHNRAVAKFQRGGGSTPAGAATAEGARESATSASGPPGSGSAAGTPAAGAAATDGAGDRAPPAAPVSAAAGALSTPHFPGPVGPTSAAAQKQP